MYVGFLLLVCRQREYFLNIQSNRVHVQQYRGTAREEGKIHSAKWLGQEIRRIDYFLYQPFLLLAWQPYYKSHIFLLECKKLFYEILTT